MKKYLGILLLAITGTSLTSCLKDGKVNLPPGGSPPVIEFSTNLLTAPTSDVNSPVAVYTEAYEVLPTVDLDITVGYTGGAPAPEDITVNLDNEGADKIAAYNEYKDEAFEMMPTNLYSMPSSVVIKKGENFAKFKVTFKPDQFDLSKAFVLPLHISSTSSGTISGNFGTILLAVGVKNKYDGVYQVTGTMVDKTNSALTHINDFLGTDGPMEYQLRTLTATKCEVYDNFFFGGFYTPISAENGGNYSNYGSFCIIIEFDPATDKVVAVTNRFGQPATNGRYAKVDASGTNEYDPATKTMAIKYNMVGGSGVGPDEVRTTWNEVWKFKEARP